MYTTTCRHFGHGIHCWEGTLVVICGPDCPTEVFTSAVVQEDEAQDLFLAINKEPGTEQKKFAVREQEHEQESLPAWHVGRLNARRVKNLCVQRSVKDCPADMAHKCVHG